MKSTESLTTEELAECIRYDARIIRERLKDSDLIDGLHYIRPSGGRKVLYLWEPIKRDIFHHSGHHSLSIPKAN